MGDVRPTAHVEDSIKAEAQDAGRASPASGGLHLLAALQRSAGNRATTALIGRRPVPVQRHALPTAEGEWQPPPSPPGIWDYLVSFFGGGAQTTGGGGRTTPTTPTTSGGEAPPETSGGDTATTPVTTGGDTATTPTTTGGDTATTPTTSGGGGDTATTPTTSGGTTSATPTTTTTGGTTSATPTTTTGGSVAPTTSTTPSTSTLTASGSYAAYASAAATIRSNWTTYPDADARGRALGNAAIAALTAANVHPPTITMADLPAGNGGNFAFTGWTLTLARLPFAPAVFSDAVFNNAYEVVYHEARHCEQWFRMARLRAGAGRTASQIVTDMSGIDATAAARAFANPITAGSAEAAEATVWWDSVYGAGGAHRGAVLTEVMAALNAFNSAQSADTAASTPATQATLATARTRFTTAYAAYRALPEEADAFGTETALRSALATAIASASTASTGTTPSTTGTGSTPAPTTTPPTTTTPTTTTPPTTTGTGG